MAKNAWKNTKRTHLPTGLSDEELERLYAKVDEQKKQKKVESMTDLVQTAKALRGQNFANRSQLTFILEQHHHARTGDKPTQAFAREAALGLQNLFCSQAE